VAVKLRCHPIYNPITSLVYVGTNSVEYCWVEGKLLLEKRKLKTIDEHQLNKNASLWRDKILSWDISRKRVRIAKLREALKEAEEVNSKTDNKKVEEVVKSLSSIQASMFHWLFFAARGEKTGASVQELQEIATAVSSKLTFINEMFPALQK